MDIDLKPLFESKLCTLNVHESTFEGRGNFPEFDTDTSTVTLKYERSISELVYDENLYKLVFPESKNASNETAEGKSPITFDIDFYFIRRNSPDPKVRQRQKLELQKEFI